MTQMGYDASTESADSILREVDFGRKGAIEFQDYLDVSGLYSINFLIPLLFSFHYVSHSTVLKL